MKKTYRSKVSWWLLTPIAVVLIGLIVLMASDPKGWPSALMVIGVSTFIFAMFFNTKYTILGSTLVVQCGWVYRRKIEILEIQSLAPSTDIISSPALSLDRLEIVFGKRERLLISPKNTDEFIASLQAINSAIVYRTEA